MSSAIASNSAERPPIGKTDHRRDVPFVIAQLFHKAFDNRFWSEDRERHNDYTLLSFSQAAMAKTDAAETIRTAMRSAATCLDRPERLRSRAVEQAIAPPFVGSPTSLEAVARKNGLSASVLQYGLPILEA